MVPSRNAGFIFNDKGMALVELATRPSTTAPGRIKCAFTVEVTEDLKLVAGDKHIPIAEADKIGQPAILGSEFRLEMN
jgi:hypothetical protein